MNYAIPRLLEALGLSAASPVQWELFCLALVPPGSGSGPNNDRLEFLGDEVLRFLAARYVYERYPTLLVGDLTILRSHLVSNETLAQWSQLLHLDPCLPAGMTDSQRANALEALIGALYLSTVDAEGPKSGNFQLILGWLYPLFDSLAEAVLADPTRRNYKAALQEWSQHYLKELPDYRLVAGGGLFTYEVWLKDHLRGLGQGTSKKRAQQLAAQDAYIHLPPELLRLSPVLTAEQTQILEAYRRIAPKLQNL
ncbi:ribonuclease III family protein [Anthocerotibacter panamensis]|uniref:ribonuclease III family protein n=1 Tax=Anthocerotibacter panamensis TaxID=2857077 RepID=UPI001C403676|nr:ribonuclease III domain-containing protein [Anthocerotibacter panamensis]